MWRECLCACWCVCVSSSSPPPCFLVNPEIGAIRPSPLTHSILQNFALQKKERESRDAPNQDSHSLFLGAIRRLAALGHRCLDTNGLLIDHLLLAGGSQDFPSHPILLVGPTSQRYQSKKESPPVMSQPTPSESKHSRQASWI